MIQTWDIGVRSKGKPHETEGTDLLAPVSFARVDVLSISRPVFSGLVVFLAIKVFNVAFNV